MNHCLDFSKTRTTLEWTVPGPPAPPSPHSLKASCQSYVHAVSSLFRGFMNPEELRFTIENLGKKFLSMWVCGSLCVGRGQILLYSSGILIKKRLERLTSLCLGYGGTHPAGYSYSDRQRLAYTVGIETEFIHFQETLIHWSNFHTFSLMIHFNPF
jgi:hypothetical protein